MRRVESRSWFVLFGSAVLGVTFAMTACGGDDDGDDGGAGSANGGTTTAGNGGAQTGGAQATGGAPSAGGVAGRQQFEGMRRNTAPSAN